MSVGVGHILCRCSIILATKTLARNNALDVNPPKPPQNRWKSGKGNAVGAVEKRSGGVEKRVSDKHVSRQSQSVDGYILHATLALPSPHNSKFSPRFSSNLLPKK